MHYHGSLRFGRAAAFTLLLCNWFVLDATAATIVVRAGDNLQAALNAAQPGDTIVLEPGATFTGNFILPVKTGAQYITVRSDDPSGLLLAAGVRITPMDAPRLAKIRSGNTMAALSTATGAHHWRLTLLEFQANREGYGEIIQIGAGSSAQSHPSQIPYEIELDRVYIHGDPVMGQKRGIALNGGTVNIRNSHISDIRGVGMDTQAIGGWNGTGPYLIENNYLEAAGENIMFGGADPYIQNLVPSNIVIRGNHLTRPMTWRDPVVATPTSVVAQGQPGGSLAGGWYGYRVVARKRVGSGVVARSSASAESIVAVPAGGLATVSWTPVPGAHEYYVYVRTPTGGFFWTTSNPSFSHTAAGGTAGLAPTSDGHTWTVKNLLELKNARNVIIELNVFENHWAGAQAGYSIVFTPRNQDGGCSWCVVEDVTFSHNTVRNAAAGINVLGHDDLQPSQQVNRLRVTHNIFQLRRSLGGNAWFMLIGNGPRDITVDHNTIDADGTTVLYVYGWPTGGVRPVTGFRFTNNAARHGDYGINGDGAGFGSPIIGLYFGDGTVSSNWLQGGTPSRYPGNYVDGTFSSAFTNVAAGDFSAAPGGPLVNRATDGGHIGADTMAATTMTMTISGRRSVPATPGGLRIAR
jgi:hypothetical protein